MKYLGVLAIFLLCVSCQSYRKMATSSHRYEIENLIINKSPCFGACPTYKLEVTKDGKAYLDARNFLKNDLKGKYTTKLNTAHLQRLSSELNNLEFPKLKDRYGDNRITDLPATDLEIRYNGHFVKKIYDYGNQGTPALAKFYADVDSLVYAQQWQKAE